MVNIDCRLSVKYGKQVQDFRSPRYRCPGRNPRLLLPLATVVSRSAFAELANCFRNHRGLVTFRWCEDAMENCHGDPQLLIRRGWTVLRRVR